MKYVYLVGATLFFPMIFIMINGMRPGAYYQHEIKFLFDSLALFFFTAMFLVCLKQYLNED